MSLRLMTGRIAAVVTTIWIGPTASAHPGHGVVPAADSAAHYLFEPVHGLAAVVLSLVTIVTVAQWFKSRVRAVELVDRSDIQT